MSDELQVWMQGYWRDGEWVPGHWERAYEAESPRWLRDLFVPDLLETRPLGPPVKLTICPNPR
ncbi:hypothetical protein SEA_JEFE_19 [Microbacterium phage Jefe]|uniref:Uncharacterized protein n=2 Tax=Quhwahvirus paschalis TaxID=2182400 RepID=A0A2U8UPW5_9CAUD|nr:hypothetical protein HOT30_gp18 [Microbacterium phage Paschalis]AWN05511.1 hypothetical protein SEA_PASCHALIS_18 [Microbacterium phage Paschalis]QDP45412.1 hypothetical protein SEA_PIPERSANSNOM_19 [Microbacterium phage PiperSansNom]WBF79167.1 hypothetical protein SEA_JEFE_19 [Microbacterium phage Jefe]